MLGNANRALEKENLLVDVLAAVSGIFALRAEDEQERMMLGAWAPDFRRHRYVNEQLRENGDDQADQEIAILKAFIDLLDGNQVQIDPANLENCRRGL